jgi:exodeoxyribonuclease VII large subunit
MPRRTPDQELQLGFDMAPVLPPKKHEPPVVMPAIPLPDPSTAVAPDEPVVLSVGQLTRRITGLLEGGIGTVWVEGEISNLRRQSSGHSYFTLKDEESQLSCVLFARSAAGKTELRDGIQVQLHGKISVYQPRGQYQLVVRLVQSKGEGMLQARFEELKRRLAEEGLFDQERKKPLPRFPRRIGVVTSPTGAAVRDFLNVLHRRHPGLRVVIHPVRVQGKGAAAEIAAAVSEFSRGGDAIGPVDVIVVTRGGGSLEDLWEFNEESVARAIADSAVPVVSAVGHEIDFSIADFVADFRAPTPSAAAEILAADGGELLDRCRSLVGRIGREAMAVLQGHAAGEHRLSSSALFREPLRRLEEVRQTMDRAEDDLAGLMNRRIEGAKAGLATAGALLSAANPAQLLSVARQRLSSMRDQLDGQTGRRLERDRGRLDRVSAALAALSPEATLARGFSITRTAEGKVITSASQVKKGDCILTQLAEGAIESEVKE